MTPACFFISFSAFYCDQSLCKIPCALFHNWTINRLYRKYQHRPKKFLGLHCQLKNHRIQEAVLMTKSEGKKDSNLISLKKVTFPHQLRAKQVVINKHGDETEIPSEEAHREQQGILLWAGMSPWQLGELYLDSKSKWKKVVAKT